MNVFDVEASFSLDTSEFENKIKQAGKNINIISSAFQKVSQTIGGIEKTLTNAADKITGSFKKQEEAAEKTTVSYNQYRSDVMKLAATYRKAGDDASTAIKRAHKEIQESYEKQGIVVEKATKKTNKNQEELAETAKRSSRDFAANWDKAAESIEKMADRVKATISAVAKAGAAAVATASTAITAIVSQSTAAYANYEQLVGGVETLFKGSADKVKAYADAAYKTAGMSVNQYMETVTSFSASLLQGLGGDTEKAADLANQAIIDMSDNANKMGTDISMIQNAYQGFAKQNYTMLDNLKLGYGGTQAEMARLINDSGVLGDTIEVTAETVNEVSFAKIIEAIHVIQEEMGLTGTTAAEAAGTISGSAGSMKAAWENLMVEIAKDDGNISQKIDEFAASAEVAFTNAYNRIERVVTNIVNFVVEKFGLSDEIEEIKGKWDKLSSEIGSKVDYFVENVFKPVAEWAKDEAIPAAFNVISGAINVLRAAIEYLEPKAIALWENFLKPLREWAGDKVVDLLNLLGDALNAIAGDPVVVEHLTNVAVAIVGLKVASSVITGIQTLGTALVTLGTSAKAALAGMSGLTKVFAVVGAAIAGWEIGSLIYEKFEDEINGVLWPIFDEVVEWWNDIAAFFTETIPEFFADIADWFVEMWDNIVSFFKDAVDSIETGWSVIIDFFSGIWQGIQDAFSATVEFFGGLFSAAEQGIEDAWSSVVGFFTGIWDGISGAFDSVTGFFGDIFSDARETIEDIFGPIEDFFRDVWSAIKTVFNPAYDFFSSIFESVKDAVRGPLNFIIDGINWVIDGLNKISFEIPDWVPGVGGKEFGIDIDNVPRLADGGVLTGEQLFIGGEYPGARMNPEIVTPQNIMRDTFRDVLSEFGNRGGAPVIHIDNITINAENPEDENFGNRVLDKIVEAIEDRRLGEIIAQGGTGW